MSLIDQSALLIPSAETETSPTEMIPVGEAASIAAVTAEIEPRVRVDATATGVAHRDAHPKAHGCVEARFEVLSGLPPVLAVGLFATPRTYRAWIRFSNGGEKPRPDKVGDGRGAAIKVMGVEASRSGTQDFLMMNSPVFFVRNASDYVVLERTIDHPLKFLFPSLNPLRFRVREGLVLMSILSRKISNPLNIRYWSVAAFLYGERVCKFSLRPVGPPSKFVDRSAPDFLRDNLVSALRESEATFDFCVQLRSSPAMPVEDPTIEWRESESPFVPVARVVIPRQEFDTPERRTFSENLSFTPWHGLDAHRPLGGINRARRVAYEAISQLRHEINGAPRREPTADDDREESHGLFDAR